MALHEELLEQPAFRGTRGGALPTVDPGSLPASPIDAPGASPKVDVLIGHTADEGTFSSARLGGRRRRPSDAGRRRPPVPHRGARSVIDRYRERAAARRPGRPTSLLVEIATDAMVASRSPWASARAERGRRRGRRAPLPRRPSGRRPGASRHPHVEVPLVFGTWHDGGPGERLGGQAAGRRCRCRRMVGAWGRSCTASAGLAGGGAGGAGPTPETSTCSEAGAAAPAVEAR